MNSNDQNRPIRNLHLDNIGSVAVLAAAVLMVTSAAFSAFTGSTVEPMQMARQGAVESRTLVASANVAPAPRFGEVVTGTLRRVWQSTDSLAAGVLRPDSNK